VLVLGIDTCDLRGSVALLQDEALLGLLAHDSPEEYSSWLLPAVSRMLGSCGLKMEEIGGYAAAAGPGSFTGVRVGLTAVKAWSEVYGKPVAGVSRLEAIATQALPGASFVAAFVEAQRGQVFGAVYRRGGEGLERVGEEMVISPGKFVEAATELATGGKITWISPDPGCVPGEPEWAARARLNEAIEPSTSVLAPIIGAIGGRRLAAGQFTDALRLDANYVRRSDAEILWKGGSAHGS